jgi:FeS assembly SUF system protein
MTLLPANTPDISSDPIVALPMGAPSVEETATSSTDATSAEATSTETSAATEPLTAVDARYPDETTPNTVEAIHDAIVEGFKTIYDPEIPVDIWQLGLIYGIEVSEDRNVYVRMTLTSPMCPTAQSLVGQVELAAREAPHVKDATVELVWEPPWTMDNMSEEARLLLGF